MTKSSVAKCAIPDSSEIFKYVERPSYKDSYCADVDEGLSATDAYRAIFGHTPAWIMALMSVRNKIAAAIGLQDLSKSDLANVKNSIHQTPYEVGARAGMFSVISVTDKEVILGEDDSHLNFRISVAILGDAGQKVYVSTVVEENNKLGRVYMFIVKPFHKVIAPYVVRNAKNNGRL